MAHRLLPWLVPALVAALLPAQTPRVSLIFTQRFDAASLDPAGGSLALLREFDLTLVTPGAGAAARAWLPTTTWNVLWGDPHGDGLYTRFHGWKANALERFNFHGLLVKHADRGLGDRRRVFFTIRDDQVGKRFEVFLQGGGRKHQLRTGDFVRFLPNGEAEFFITQDLIMKAAGTQYGLFIPGASALCQDGQGNLYYSPPQGSPVSGAAGHWVGGQWANDGAIAMIPAGDITYDGGGNVADVRPGCALLLLEEVGRGANGEPSVNDLIQNSGALDTSGSPITGTANTVALAIDPRGGTFTGSFPIPGTANHPVAANLIFGSDLGVWGGTLLATAGKGTVAVLNGFAMGSTTQAADGSWLGIQGDPASERPTLMGLDWIAAIPDPFTLDARGDGAILPADATLAIDAGYLVPGTLAVLLIAPGPLKPGAFLPAADLTGFLGPESFSWYFLLSPPVFGQVLAPAGSQGYTGFAAPKPVDPALLGATLVGQGARVNLTGFPFTLSNPILLQFR